MRLHFKNKLAVMYRVANVRHKLSALEQRLIYIPCRLIFVKEIRMCGVIF